MYTEYCFIQFRKRPLLQLLKEIIDWITRLCFKRHSLRESLLNKFLEPKENSWYYEGGKTFFLLVILTKTNGQSDRNGPSSPGWIFKSIWFI